MAERHGWSLPDRVGSVILVALLLAAVGTAPIRPAAAAAAPAYAGYLFVHFDGEATPTGEQVHFALSRGNDPLHWRPAAQGRPVLTSTVGTRGVRDPCIVRSPSNDRFYLIGTDMRQHGRTELYAVPAVLGAVIVAVAYRVVWPAPVVAVAAAAFVVVFRLIALWRRWHAPSARRLHPPER